MGALAEPAPLRTPLSKELVVKSGLSPGIPRRLARATWVSEPATRDGAPIIYVFTDPRCPYCHRLWQQIRRLSSRPVEFRYVLVGVIAPQSGAQAAAILQAEDPLAALTRHEAMIGQGG